MGVHIYETETTSKISLTRKFNAFVVDADNLIPKVAPHSIKSHVTLQGNGGPGTIKKITFAEGSQFKHVKHRIDEVDHANFSFSYTVIEGDVVSSVIQKVSYEFKMVASSDGGCILKGTSKYHTKGNHQIKVEEVKFGHEMVVAHFKAVEAHLLAHPRAYK